MDLNKTDEDSAETAFEGAQCVQISKSWEKFSPQWY